MPCQPVAGYTALTTPMPASVLEKVGFAAFVFKGVVTLSRLARPGKDTRPRFPRPLNSLKTRNLCRQKSADMASRFHLSATDATALVASRTVSQRDLFD